MDGINPSDQIKVDNAIIEALSTQRRTGFVTISYQMREGGRNTRRQSVVLVTSDRTRMTDQFGNRIGFRNLRVGMVINATFSKAMTRSIPPQANAFSIIIVKENKSSLIEMGRVIRIEEIRGVGYILTGDPRNPNRQMRYVISETTKIRNRRGTPIPLRVIRRGQIVRIERQPFQTLSIPPQTSALSVQIVSRQ